MAGMKSTSLLSLLLLGIFIQPLALAQQFVLPTIPKRIEPQPEPQPTPQPAQKPKEQPKPSEIIETSPHPRQTWTNVPDSLFYSDALYTPYDIAIYQALEANRPRVECRQISASSSRLIPIGNNYPYDSTFSAMDSARKNRSKLSDANKPLMGLAKIAPLPEGSRVRYKDGKLEVAAPEQSLVAIDKQLKCKSYQISEIFNKISFPGEAPRTDALLYLFVHLGEESTRILQPAGQKNKPGKNYAKRVSELIDAASWNADIEVVITVDPQLEKKRILRAFKYLKLKKPVYGTATATTKKPKEGDYAIPQKEVPAELATLVFPNGLALPVYNLFGHIIIEHSDGGDEMFSDPSRLDSMMNDYLFNIRTYQKQYCTTEGAFAPDGTPLAKPEPQQATPAPAAEPTPAAEPIAPKKKKNSGRGFKAVKNK